MSAQSFLRLFFLKGIPSFANISHNPLAQHHLVELSGTMAIVISVWSLGQLLTTCDYEALEMWLV